MKRIKALICLLALMAALLSACGNSPADIMEDGAGRFAAGKAEESYHLTNSGRLLDELIDKYSGSYQMPVGIQIDDDDTLPTQPADTDPSDPDGTDTDPSTPSIAQVGSWEDLLRVFYDAYSTCSGYLEFETVNGFTMVGDDLQKVFTQLQRQDPIRVSCVSGWTWRHSGNRYALNISYTMDTAVLLDIMDETEALVDAAVAQIDTAGKSDYEIICAVNDYLCDTVYYPDEEPYAPVTHTAYGALHDGVAVCEGYACATKLMLNKLGIRCDIQVGTCIDGGGHGWNLVELEGEWYQMDVTWNDGGDRLAYLLVNDAYMFQSRYWETSEYPECPVMYVH